MLKCISHFILSYITLHSLYNSLAVHLKKKMDLWHEDCRASTFPKGTGISWCAYIYACVCMYVFVGVHMSSITVEPYYTKIT